jgi:hypothetical protein
MIYLKLLIYFLSIFIPGYFILLFWKKEMPFLFRLALAYGLGNFIIAVQLFLFYFILQIHVSTFSLLSIFLVEDILLFYFAHKNGCFLRNFKFFKLPKNLKIGEIILILLLVIQLVFIFFNAISRPTITFPGLWNSKGISCSISQVQGGMLTTVGAGQQSRREIPTTSTRSSRRS